MHSSLYNIRILLNMNIYLEYTWEFNANGNPDINSHKSIKTEIKKGLETNTHKNIVRLLKEAYRISNYLNVHVYSKYLCHSNIDY